MKTILAALLFLPLAPCFGQAVWTLRTLPAHTGARRPAGRPGLYLIPTDGKDGTNQIYLRSTDGAAWTKVNLPPVDPSDFTHASFFCGNGRFVGFSEQGAWTTDDGAHFAYTYTPAAAEEFIVKGAACGDGKWFAALSNGDLLRSTDNAASWQRLITPSPTARDIAYGGGKILVQTQNASMMSMDGAAWTLGSAINGSNLCYEAGFFRTTATSQMPGSALRAGNGGFLTWDSAPQPKFYISSNGLWGSGFPSGVLDIIADASFCGDMWIAVTESGRVITSPPVAPIGMPVPTLTITSGRLISWSSVGGYTYTIETSKDMRSWSGGTSKPGTGGVLTYQVNAAELLNRRYYLRVRVSITPQ